MELSVDKIIDKLTIQIAELIKQNIILQTENEMLKVKLEMLENLSKEKGEGDK